MEGILGEWMNEWVNEQMNWYSLHPYFLILKSSPKVETELREWNFW